MKRLTGYLVILGGCSIGLISLIAFVVIQSDPNRPFGTSVVLSTLALMGAAAGAGLLQFGKQVAAATAAEARAADPRAPILLLRNFRDDFLKLRRSWSYLGFFADFVRGQEVTLEELIAERLKQFGPVIAVAQPGQKIPPYGFSKMWLPDKWQHEVGKLISESQLIVFILGEVADKDEGLGWELATVLAQVPPQRVVMVVPPSDEAELLWKKFCQLSDHKLKGRISWRDCILTFSDSWEAVPHGSGKRRERDYRRSLDQLVRLKRSLLSRQGQAA